MSSTDSDLTLEVAAGIATLRFDRSESKVNLLTRAVMLRLDELLGSIEAVAATGEAGVLVIRSFKPGNFIAGADIEELAELGDPERAAETSRRGQEILERLGHLRIPTLAAIQGSCLGGGLELALACNHRIACDDPRTRLGLPETRLGILPGLGGTVRLPRLVGLRNALDLILSGRQIGPKAAARIGLIDRTVPADQFERETKQIASAFAHGAAPLVPRRRSIVQRLLIDGPLGRPLIRLFTRRAILARSRGHYPALPLALDVTVAGLGLPAERAYERESQAFGRLAASPECHNLIHVFKITEDARKRRPAGRAVDVERAGVIGAGVMGAGIAELFAYQGVPVRVLDVDAEHLESGLERARTLLGKAAERAEWPAGVRRMRLDCLQGATGYEELADVDLVIEAVLERSDVKREVFARLEEHTRPEAVLTTNTSALSVSRLQQGLSNPARACGLHFFNPPHRMPLVEVVRGQFTSPDALATAFTTAVRLGKTPVVVSDSPGFVVNRILAAYLTETGYLLESGIRIRELDRLMTDFGMPVGPVRLLDEIGLDVVTEVGATMVERFGERFASAAAVEEVLASGLKGRKGGVGFYRWDGSRIRGTNPEVETILYPTSEAAAGPEEARERLIFSMINEASRVLDEGVVDSSGDLDVAMILGTGFPPFRGGLLRYADSLGLARINARLKDLRDSVGPRFDPAPGLTSRAAFYSN